MTFVTIRAFDTTEEAHLAKGHLEAAGIPATIRNEFTVGVDWALSNAVGGIEVQVPEADVDAARSVLDLPSPATMEVRPPACPSCGSTNTEPCTLMRRVALFSVFVFSIPVPFSRYSFQCLDCRHKWRL